jgi:hypothetical protein
MVDEIKRLAEWEAALEREVERWQGERNRIDSELQRAAKKLELVRQMISLDGNSGSKTEANALNAKDGRTTPTAVREMTQRILAEAARPLHISEIHKQFVDRGHAIPGSGTAFNILAHLVNDKSFVRVARGTYALAGSVPQDQVLPRAERKQKRRRRKKKSTARLAPKEG